MTRNRNNYEEDERYAHYTDDFDPVNNDRQAHRKRKPKVKHTPKKSTEEQIEELAADSDMALQFETTYQPSLYEGGWLLQSLQPFFVEQAITDVMALVKGGKEASVYRCAAHERFEVEWLAAKVYRPRQFRQLRNDAAYREGRQTLTGDGKAVKETDHRILRALGKKSTFGAQVAHTSWLMYEYTTMRTLYAAGAAVPQPVAASDNAILMSYLGDEQMAAPTLSEVAIEPDDAPVLFAEIMRNIELFLDHGVVHGDLSAYNILYWQGAVIVIDFPQVMDIHANSQAEDALERDITRVCDYFSRFGLARDPAKLARRLWRRYVQVDPANVLADQSRYDVEEE